MPDIYQAVANTYEDFKTNPACYGVFGPLVQWFTNCPEPGVGGNYGTITPVVVTPAAPRSIPELTSGTWSPAEAWRLTQERRVMEQQRMRDIYAAGQGSLVNPTGMPQDTEQLSVSEWVLLGGLFVAGAVVIREIVR